MPQSSDLYHQNVTGYLFGLLYDCAIQGACKDRDCELRRCWQVDLATTFAHLRALSPEDRLLLLYKYERCSLRFRARVDAGHEKHRRRSPPLKTLH